ncbi:MAG: hypothetical protein ACRDDZ_12500 [Marinifilaceae bacterium]
MANIKRLKKDIDFLTSSVVADCIQYTIVSGGENYDKVEELITSVLASRNELRGRVCDGKRVPATEKKAYYTAIFRDLLQSVDEAFTELSNVIKK